MTKKTLIIPLLFTGLVCTAQNVSVPSTDTVERTMATTEETTTQETTSSSTRTPRSRRGSRRTSANGARGRVTVTNNGIVDQDTSAVGNSAVTVDVNGETVTDETSSSEGTPTVTTGRTSSSTSGTTSSLATGGITVSDTEGIIDQDINTIGNASATLGANGEIVAEESSNEINSTIAETSEATTSSNGPNRAGGLLELRGGEVTNATTAVSGNSSNGSRSASIVSGGETLSETTSEGTEVANTEIDGSSTSANNETPEATTENTISSTSGTTSSIATGSITVSDTEGIVDQNIETTGNASATLGANGEIVAEETSTNEETETETPTVTTETPSSSSLRVVLFPNPATDVLNISAFRRAKLSRIEISATSGEVVLAESLGGISRTRINVSSLQQGLYVAKIYSDSGVSTKRFLKN